MIEFMTLLGRFCLLLVACLVLVAPPAPTLAGDDESMPTGGPTLPGEDDGDGEGVAPFVPSGSRHCAIAKMRRVGPGMLLGVAGDGVSCRHARRLAWLYQRCLDLHSDRGCFDEVSRRCVQPEFLGHCRAYDLFYRRTLDGFRCIERRRYEIGARYNGDVTCLDGRRRVDHGYSLFVDPAVSVDTERELRAAWGNPLLREIHVTRDLVLNACRIGDPIRESVTPIVLDGGGHTLRQGCFEKRLLRQDGTGFVEIRDVTLTRGGSDGPGAALTSRGEIAVVDSRVVENLAEEPGGGVMSQRGVTVIHSVITGNLANDDGGGVYARRGGIRVFDSIISSNLVDGSGGALGSTGDILVVRSHIDGNTTDGDGGAIYADEDGDVTVIDSTVNGSDADGPGGAIFTLDGDVTVIGSTLNGNRADDRGGAISGEADVTVINSTIARNAAVAHVAGGVWARGDVYIANSTISGNYAEGQGGGILGAGEVGLVNSTVAGNIAPVGANVGAGDRLELFGSVIGPPPSAEEATGGQVQPTGVNCQTPRTESFGYNLASDRSCGLNGPGDQQGVDTLLEPLALNGGLGETQLPKEESPLLDLIPSSACLFKPFGDAHEGEQHLAGLVDYPAVAMGRDQRGTGRPQGDGCDAGAVEVAP
jgi:predicted outer membrane repeat protein